MVTNTRLASSLMYCIAYAPKYPSVGREKLIVKRKLLRMKAHGSHSSTSSRDKACALWCIRERSRSDWSTVSTIQCNLFATVVVEWHMRMGELIRFLPPFAFAYLTPLP